MLKAERKSRLNFTAFMGTNGEKKKRGVLKQRETAAAVGAQRRQKEQQLKEEKKEKNGSVRLTKEQRKGGTRGGSGKITTPHTKSKHKIHRQKKNLPRRY